MAYLCCLIWNTFLLSGTVYMIGWKHWSPWWILIVFALVMTHKEN